MTLTSWSQFIPRVVHASTPANHNNDIAERVESQASYKMLRMLIEIDQVGWVIFFDNEAENAWQMGLITAVEAKALGIHQIYAPVNDVNNNPSYPVINVRSFSEDPSTESLYANEFIEGVQSTGLLATAKHFLGHDNALLDIAELPPFREAIIKAVHEEAISEDRIDISLRKLLYWKFKLGLFDDRTSDTIYTANIVGHRDHRIISERIARESVTLLQNEKSLLPLSPVKQKRILFLGVANDRSGTTGKALADEMFKFHPAVKFMSLNPNTTATQQQVILRAARASEVTIVAKYHAVVAGELTKKPGLCERFLKQIQDVPTSALMHSDYVDKIDDIMARAISERVFPGGVVAVVKNGVTIHHKAYGSHTYDDDARVYKTDDIFDLASLTKVIATTTAVMRLVDQGKLSVDDRVSNYIREFDTVEKRGITIKQLLIHESGLPAFRVYVDKLKTKTSILDAILNEPLTSRPSSQYVYSDLGFITLAHIVEKVSGVSFDTYMSRELYEPLGMHSTQFNPLDKDPLLIERIPPTEIDTVHRTITVKGQVHDERAWYMGGVAGHAGLFSTAGDIAIWATMLLQQGQYGGYRVSSNETVKMFTARQSVLAKRGYGFDMKSSTGFSSAGTLMSATTFGHTGFTGTSVWVDPERDLAIIVLTNRTWPYRGTSGPIGRVRASIADVVVQSINK